MSDSSTPSLQGLLQHRQWVRDLARTLVLDEARADDLEQQTWLAALKKPPTGDTPKAWLGAVLRNLAGRMRRSEYRVDRREGAAAKGERLPATADVVAQAELHRQVVQAVLDLDSPYRGTVLLRHYEGLAPREVAGRMGVPVETVRSRTRRGLEQVRARLQREHGSDGNAWRFALLPLARLADGGAGSGAAAGSSAAVSMAKTGGALTTGALLMAAKSKLMIATVTLLLVASGAWFLFGENAGADDDQPPAAVAGVEAGAASGPALHASGVSENTAATPGAAAEPAPAMPVGAAWVRIVRGEGEAAPGVGEAMVIVAAPHDTSFNVLTDAWGRAEVPPRAVGYPTAIWIVDEAGRTAERRRTTLGAGENLLRLPAPRTVEMRFQDEHGAPLSAADVERRYAEAGLKPIVHLVSGDVLSSTDRGLQLETMLGLSLGASYKTQLVFDGERVVLALAPSEGSWQLLLEPPHAAPDLSNSFRVGAGGDATSVAMVMPGKPDRQTVQIVDTDDQPVAGAVVTPYFEIGDDAAFFEGASIKADGSGEVSLPAFDKRGRRGQRAPTWWVTHGSRSAKIPSSLVNRPSEGKPVKVTLYKTATIEGHAFAPTGEPAVNRTITWGSKGLRRRTQVAADGTYRLSGVHVGRGARASLWLVDDLAKASMRSANVTCKAGETVTHDFGKAMNAAEIGTVEGRITEAGAPLPGLLLMVSKQGSREKGRTASTDADGRYRLEGFAAGSYRLMVILGDFRISDDFQIVSLESINVKGGDTHTFDFDLPGGYVEVTLLEEATGKPVPGGVALGQAADKQHTADMFSGFRSRLGWAQSADEHGIVRLRALPTDAPLRVQFGAKSGYERGERLDVYAGTAEAPTKLEIRLKKKP